MSDTYDSCSVCDRRIDPWGRDGVRCARCNEPCPTCHGDVAYCHHKLVPFTPMRLDTAPDNGRNRVAM
jgi:predicted amidophosphoribosyltransferase